MAADMPAFLKRAGKELLKVLPRSSLKASV